MVYLTDRSAAQVESSQLVDQAKAKIANESRLIDNGIVLSKDLAGYDAGDNKDNLSAGGDAQQRSSGLSSAAAGEKQRR